MCTRQNRVPAFEALAESHTVPTAAAYVWVPIRIHVVDVPSSPVLMRRFRPTSTLVLELLPKAMRRRILRPLGVLSLPNDFGRRWLGSRLHPDSESKSRLSLPCLGLRSSVRNF